MIVYMLLYLIHICIEHKNMHLTGKMRAFLRCENMFGWSSESQRAVWGVRHGIRLRLELRLGWGQGVTWLLLGAGEHIMFVKVLTKGISTKMCVYLERLVIIRHSSWMLTCFLKVPRRQTRRPLNSAQLKRKKRINDVTNIPSTPMLMTSACPKKHQLILNRDTGSPWRISRMSYICACSAMSQTSAVSAHHLSSVCALQCPLPCLILMSFCFITF